MTLTDLTVTNDAIIQNNVKINNSLSVGDDIIVAGNLSVTRVFGHIGVPATTTALDQQDNVYANELFVHTIDVVNGMTIENLNVNNEKP